MAKLKGQDLAGFDPEELDVEWNDTDFDTYEGEQPPSGTVLRGHVKKLWWTYTASDQPMLKVLWIASGNTGENAEYNGLPLWDNLVFTPKAAFRYGPFLQVTGITLRDIQKNTYVADDDDNIGAPIEKIGKIVPGESLEAGVVTKREKYNGEWSTKVGRYIENPEQDDEDDEDEPEEQPRSRRKSPAKPAPKRRRPEPEPEDDEDEDEPDVDEEDDEDEAEPEPQPRSRKPSRARSAPARHKPAAKSRRRKPSDDEDEDEVPF